MKTQNTNNLQQSGKDLEGFTKGEWQIKMYKEVAEIRTTDFNYESNTIAAMNMDLSNAKANAEHIVKCVNSHSDLVKRLELLADFASKVLQYPKGAKGYDPVDTMNLADQIEYVRQTLTKVK